jgi:hypothetical protein
MNITLDFTANNSVKNLTENQPLAVMPAGLAKKLLEMYAENLARSSNQDIITRHIKNLSKISETGDLQAAMEASLEWIAERELIQNIQHDYWDAYEVKPVVVDRMEYPNTNSYNRDNA